MSFPSLKYALFGLFHRTKIRVRGAKNTVSLAKARRRKLSISIDGNNNQVVIAKGAVWLGAIIIKGNNCSVSIGENTVCANSTLSVCAGNNNHIRIGKDCLFSDQIDIWASDTHAIFDCAGKWINPEKDITIGDHVWVGRHARILKGVTIGDGAVIGMGATITHDVPARCVVVGGGCAPQKIVRENISWSKNYPTEKRL